MNQRELFLRHVAQTSDSPMLGKDLNIVSATGCTLTDVQGKQYTDLISGISVSSVGHCHPAVVKAVKEQSERYMHLMVYGEYNQAPQVEYAFLLLSQLSGQLDNIYFTTGGSEAVEGALKLAKRYTGRSEIVCFSKAYHGSTHGALSVMGDEYFRNAYRPLLPDIRQLEFNDIESITEISERTAAVIIEPVQGEAGVRVAFQEFITALRKQCDATGALLIFDEIQTGFGRTGTLFAFEQFHVTPDVLLIAKGMGGGMPIGAFIAPQKIMWALSHDPALGHINTFGGNAVCVAAATATLGVIATEGLVGRSRAIEATMRKLLIHSSIKELRIHGALAAVDLHDEQLCMKVISKCIDSGIITDWFLFCPTALRIAPPLVISDEQLSRALSKIVSILGEV
jgi:acetylornithine/N-succinyldiaminopimelate aminotransferase